MSDPRYGEANLREQLAIQHGVADEPLAAHHWGGRVAPAQSAGVLLNLSSVEQHKLQESLNQQAAPFQAYEQSRLDYYQSQLSSLSQQHHLGGPYLVPAPVRTEVELLRAKLAEAERELDNARELVSRLAKAAASAPDPAPQSAHPVTAAIQRAARQADARTPMVTW
jgi:hypothetical protein